MTSVGTSFLIMLLGVALFPIGVLAFAIHRSRRAQPQRSGFIITAVAYCLIAYAVLAGVVILPTDWTLQNILFFAAILGIIPAGLLILLVVSRLDS